MRRIGLVGLMALAMVGAAGVGTANASDLETFQNQFTGRCLTSQAVFHMTSACVSNNFSEWWWVTVAPDGGRVLGSNDTGLCLDDSAAFHLRLFDCNGLPFQEWDVIRHDNSITLKNKATGLCLDDSDLGTRTFDCNNLPYQNWY